MSKSPESQLQNSPYVIAEIAAPKKKRSTEVTSIKKRMVGGADEKINGSLNKGFENSLISVSEKYFQEAEPIAAEEDVQCCKAANTLDSLRNKILSEAYLSSTSLQGKKISMKRKSEVIGNGQICFCPSSARPGRSATGKFDEMIDYALNNLNEASKGLDNLGDNFEHDLRVMFIDIMGRVQHWVSVVENRIHAARADIESLKKEPVPRVSELTARDLEIVELKRKLNEAETKLAVQQAAQEIQPLIIAQEAKIDRPGRGSLQNQKEEEEEKVTQSVQTGPNIKNVVTSAVNTICDYGKDLSEKAAELEAQVAQLREENKRMLKDREEYENAVQCALLKGVSSLNVEAFKVLRCPPIPCCTPCVLSSENSGPCSDSPASRSAPQPARRKSSVVPIKEVENADGIIRRNCVETEPCYSCSDRDGRIKIPVENSVILLLRHGDAAGNFECIRNCGSLHPEPRSVIGSQENKDISVCVGGRCRKTTGTKTPRGPPKSPAASSLRPGSCDMFTRNRDGNCRR